MVVKAAKQCCKKPCITVNENRAYRILVCADCGRKHVEERQSGRYFTSTRRKR